MNGKNKKYYPIKVVVNRTGLSAHVIRAWEKRYGAVIPSRTSTNRRLYSDEDIRRLQLLQKATVVGYNIGRISDLPTEVLQNLVAEEDLVQETDTPNHPKSAVSSEKVDGYIAAALQAVRNLERTELEDILQDATRSIGAVRVIESIIMPVLQHIGNLWRDGDIRIIHEHMASAVFKVYLGNIIRSTRTAESAPQAIATTPAGQQHELGVMIVAALAATEGWRVTYLGPDLPAEEIGAAVRKRAAKVLLLSIVYPTDDSYLPLELEKLRRALPEQTHILAGGRAISAYAGALEHIGALIMRDVTELRQRLRAIHPPDRDAPADDGAYARRNGSESSM